MIPLRNVIAGVGLTALLVGANKIGAHRVQKDRDARCRVGVEWKCR